MTVMSTAEKIGETGATEALCSDVDVEPLAGSAKQESVYVLFEWPGGWSHDILDGGTFSPELTARLKDKLDGQAGLQLIRRPGRAGRQVGSVHRCYLVWAERGVMEMLLLEGPEGILDLDLSGPGRNGGGEMDTPLVLVCTHSKRDKCCAIKGRPLAAQLSEIFPAIIWETSHTKGHRFAPSVLLMPWGYSFGRLNLEAAREMTKRALNGSYFYPANRGRGLYSQRGQVAELEVARRLIEAGEEVGYADLRPADAGSGPVRVSHRDGRHWEIELVQREYDGIVASCGKEPKSSLIWEVA